MSLPRAFPKAEETSTDDDRVTFTKRNWTGRFLRAEVNYGDFQRIMGKIQTWDQWLPAWAEKATEYESLAEAAEKRGARHSAAEAWRRAAMCWHYGKFNWFVDLDKAQRTRNAISMPATNAPCGRSNHPARKCSFPTVVLKWRQSSASRPAVERPPVVILIGGLDLVKEELQQVADYFLDRGMAALALDGPGQGETGLTLKIEPASEKPIGAAIDFLESMPDVDVGRLGIYGQSLGGYYVVRAAAFETRIKAGVESAGPYAIADHWEHLPPMTRAGYQYRLGASSSTDALERISQLDLTGVAEKVACPLLVLHGTADEVVPFAHGERIAREAKNATFRKYENGNHSLSNRHFEVRTGLADWLAQQIGGTL